MQQLEVQGNCAEVSKKKKPISKGYTWYNFIYITLSPWHNCRLSGSREYGKRNDVNIEGDRNEREETTVILAMAFPQTYNWENCIRTPHMPYFVGGHIQVNEHTWSWGGVIMSMDCLLSQFSGSATVLAMQDTTIG